MALTSMCFTPRLTRSQRRCRTYPVSSTRTRTSRRKYHSWRSRWTWPLRATTASSQEMCAARRPHWSPARRSGTSSRAARHMTSTSGARPRLATTRPAYASYRSTRQGVSRFLWSRWPTFASTPNAIERTQQSRRIDVGANVEGRDLGSAVSAVEDRIARVDLPREYHMEVLGESSELAAAQKSLLLYGIAAALAILFLLQASFGSIRLALVLFLTLPMALAGGVLAVWMGSGILSLGSLIGFLTVFGIAARNGILMVSHFQHLEREEGEVFGHALVLRGAKERLAPILMTASATGLALVPLAVAGSVAGNEIEHPMAIVILGGLVTSTLLNLFVLPSLYLRFGKSKKAVGGDPAAG